MKSSQLVLRSWLVPAVAAALLADALDAQGNLLDRQRRMLPWNGPGPVAVTGTFDADAYPDVLALSFELGGAQPGLRLFKGSATGSLESAGLTAVPVGAAVTNMLLAGDFDLDAKLDVAWFGEAQCSPYMPGCAGGFVSLWRGDGAGGFSVLPGAFPGADALRFSCVESGDMTGDGLPELVAGTLRHSWSNPLGGPTQYEGGGAARWIALGGGMYAAPATAFPDGYEADVRALGLADVDLDGDLDLYRSQGIESITKNLGGGAMGAPANFSNGTTSPSKDALFVDADLDGDPDLVITTGISAPDQVRLLRNDGSGSFTIASGATPQWGFANSIELADANRDGRDDLLLVGTLNLALWLGSGSGFVEGAPVPDSFGPARVLVADFDQDSDDDLLALRFSGTGLHLLGAQGWQKVSSPDTGQSHQTAQTASFDRDGDGDLDVIVSSPNAWNAVLDNDGSGRFASVSGGEWTAAYTATSQNHYGVDLASADLEGDGDVDLVTARSYSTSPALSYRNQGGAFTSQVDFPAATSATAVSLADIDGNGLSDAVFAINMFPAPTLQVHMNSAGSFAIAPGVLAGSNQAYVQLLADLDSDGDPDFVQGLGAYAPHPCVLLRTNNWPAAFTPSAVAVPSAGSEFAASIAAADVDQDGDLDLLVGTGSQSGPALPRLMLNTPGAFVDASLPVGAAWTTDIEFADFDADGDDDVLLVNQAGAHKLLASTGGGSFSDVSALTPTGGYMAGTIRAEVGDFDGDDDLDAVFAGYGVIDTWFGLRRQLAWSNVPAIGKPLDFELHGAPGSPWWLALSTAQASIPLPGFGTLLLHPSTLLLIGQGLQDASGEAHRTFALPADPTLVGIEVYAQALLGAPLALGNLERVQFTDL